ncbi:hypothetical protein G7Y89_g11546 [Cudoniella acicularis]|uniref:Zn(2)-C6 fungal-type domain-containing protein n=1 Tax=Cudoniella acicularis TaxID=354080 RepID=A0A8H4VXX0_9HELO|nr:hypothetical protein G7Y89_g11546 [Cudoniella acicularis]
MVNTGKPSKGCYMCRSRRIKCDEGKPSCIRCQKSKRVCPGYRDAFELNLRDETKSTKKKMSRMINHRPFVDGVSKFDAHHEIINSPDGLLMTTPITTANLSMGYLDFLIPHIKAEKPNPSFLAAFSAVALAALGTRPNSKALLPKADMAYVKALKKINCTLRDAQMASDDSMLAAVLMLSFFEQLTAPRLNPEAWSSHVDGAVALLKARGPDEFQTPTGREVWNTVRAMMAIQCIANSRRVDLGVEWWMAVPAKDGLSHQFASLNIKVADLRSDTDIVTVMPHTSKNYEAVLKLLRQAEELEREYEEWFSKLKGPWEVKSVAWIDSSEISDLTTSLVHPGKVDSYSEMWMAYHHNIGRSSRLFIWATILRCIAWLCDSRDYSLTPEYNKASQVCRQLIEDTVASVPFVFGWKKGINEFMADNSSFACGSTENPEVKSLWGIFVMWPLFAAASSDFASVSQRTFLRGRLSYISEALGIYQASVLLRFNIFFPSLYIERSRSNSRIHQCFPNKSEDEFLVASPKPVPKSMQTTSIPATTPEITFPTPMNSSPSPIQFSSPEKDPIWSNCGGANPFPVADDLGFSSDKIHELIDFTTA